MSHQSFVAIRPLPAKSTIDPIIFYCLYHVSMYTVYRSIMLTSVHLRVVCSLVLPCLVLPCSAFGSARIRLFMTALLQDSILLRDRKMGSVLLDLENAFGCLLV